MLILRKDKYISAAPRCTCLPPHQHCTEVALGGKQVHLGCASMYLSSSSCNFSSSPPRSSPGTTRLRLVVPGLDLGGLERSRRCTTSARVGEVRLRYCPTYIKVQFLPTFAGASPLLSTVCLRGGGSEFFLILQKLMNQSCPVG